MPDHLLGEGRGAAGVNADKRGTTRLDRERRGDPIDAVLGEQGDVIAASDPANA